MVIYDFGSNNGDDLPYYLLRADKVVAVEANPSLCDQIVSRFSSEMNTGRLAVENVVLDVTGSASEVPFYIHKTDHVLSQFPKPDSLLNFETVMLPSARPRDLLKVHGDPYYVKIDIEHYDNVVLRDIFEAGYRPEYISAELHSIDVFCTMVALGGYSHFKLVDGRSIPELYTNARIFANGGELSYSFPRHSAGPFGNDIKGPWMTPEQIVDVIASERLGWN
jgi:FkbM family methyltransferase